MANLNQKLLDLFQSSDGLLLLDETALMEISKRQEDLKIWNEDIVFQGLILMGEFLQDLASQNKEDLTVLTAEMDWSLNEEASSQLSKINPHSSSVWELPRHLSNWMTVFTPPVREWV